VRDAAMEREVIGAGARESNEELGHIGRVRRHDAEQRGAGDVSIGDGSHQRRSDERVGEVVHTTRCGTPSRDV